MLARIYYRAAATDAESVKSAQGESSKIVLARIYYRAAATDVEDIKSVQGESSEIYLQ